VIVLEQWTYDECGYRLVVEKDGSLSVQFRQTRRWKYCSTGKQCTFCLSTMPVEEPRVATEGTIALVTALWDAVGIYHTAVGSADEPETSAPQTTVSALCVDYEPVTFAATFVGPEPEQDEPELALGNYPAPDRRKTVGEKVGDFFFKLSEWADGWRF
jgi:hypothetical protein